MALSAAPLLPNVIKSANAVSSFNLWTPAAGKRFRLMRIYLQVTSNVSISAGGGLLTLDILDTGVGPIGLTFRLYVPSTALTTGGTGWTTGWVDLGNGYRAAAADNVLQVSMSATIDGTGRVGAVACGTEE